MDHNWQCYVSNTKSLCHVQWRTRELEDLWKEIESDNHPSETIEPRQRQRRKRSPRGHLNLRSIHESNRSSPERKLQNNLLHIEIQIGIERQPRRNRQSRDAKAPIKDKKETGHRNFSRSRSRSASASPSPKRSHSSSTDDKE